MAALSPRPSVAAHSIMQHQPPPGDASQRPQLMKRQSSQSSHNSKHAALSPGSAGDYPPLRHHVKPGRKKILPRTHGSGRNLVKLAQHVQSQHAAEEERRGSRPKLRDSDSEIRLPRSLEDPSARPLRRNFTSSQLPRNTSHTKLKKNLSHGQLTKMALHSTALRGPPSPALKPRNKRPKSADMANIEKDLHEQEVEIAQQQQDKKDAPKKVGFAVGSSDGVSDGEDMPQMEGQGLQEDEWTDQSASASPYSTRQNTASNSRRPSVTMDKSLERRAVLNTIEAKDRGAPAAQQEAQETSTDGADEIPAETFERVEDDEAAVDEELEPPSPLNPSHAAEFIDAHPPQPAEEAPATQSQRTSPFRNAREHRINPATRHLLTRSTQNPAPALVSNVSALDDVRSGRNSPAPSMASTRSTTRLNGAAEAEQEELVSRFMPSASHSLTGSGVNTTSTTPKNGSLPTAEAESILAAAHKAKSASGFGVGPVSPESARSLSSSAQTPAFSRWRNEEKMANEKAMAELEDAAAQYPIVPAHVFDRRNESLKSYLNLTAMGGDGKGGLHPTTGLSKGPEIFEGRFKAVNVELKVVQRFRDPLAECVARLHLCKERDFAQLRKWKIARPQQEAISKSTASLPRQPSKLSSSMSPPNPPSPVKPSIASGKSTTQIRRGENRRSKVTFSQVSPQMREPNQPLHDADGKGADDIARMLWDSSTA